MVKKAILIFAVIISAALVTNVGRYAHADSPFCKADEEVYKKGGFSFPNLDIRKTVSNMTSSALTDVPISIITGRNGSQLAACAKDVFSKGTPATRYPNMSATLNSQCASVTTPVNCDDFIQLFNAQATDTSGFGKSQTAGSLIGLANYIQGSIDTEPVPTNLAYFWNDSIKNVPFANRALAADVSYAHAPYLPLILDLWKAARNVAFGLLAIVMLTVGMMIMFRKKLSPQLVVTAQYALPRIALAVVLIAFSYPIGAVLLSSMNYLSGIIMGIITNVAGGIEMGLGLLAIVLFVGMLLVPGAALFIVATFAITLLIVGILYIAIYITVGIIYLKLLFSIIFAPINFALGAIPGNEKSTTDWFKHAIVYVLSFVGVLAYKTIVDAVVSLIIQAPLSSWSSFFSSASLGSLFTFLFMPLVLMFGYIQALKVPKMVENFIIGEKKPRR